jgi:hypothetical protein
VGFNEHSFGLGLFLTILFRCTISAQIYTIDQQSTFPWESAAQLDRHSVVQSFTPASNRVGFVALYVGDPNPRNGLGSKVVVNLRRGTLDGQVLGTSQTLTLLDGYGGKSYFTFATNIVVDPGGLYFLEPLWLGGDSMQIRESLGYEGGFELRDGNNFQRDLLFAEGIVQSQFTSFTMTNQTFSLSWAGRGVLQNAPLITGPWVDVPGLTNDAFAKNATNAIGFFRVRR